MPQKNTIKINVGNSYYHIYNRGVEKRTIFETDQDYRVFLNYLKEALSPSTKKDNLPKVRVSVQGTSFDRPIRPPKNLHSQIELVAYCLMPNHFHLLIKQITKGAMETFMRSLLTRYSTYFNKKYDRVGPLFQGRYKAVMTAEDNYLLHLSRYIHLNPSEYTQNLSDAYSSYSDYMGIKKTNWVKPDFILAFFNKPVLPEIIKVDTYKNFVENYKKDSSQILGELVLE